MGPRGKGYPMVPYNQNLDPLHLFSLLLSALKLTFILSHFTVHEPSEPHVYPCLMCLTISWHCMPSVCHSTTTFPSLHVLHFDYRLFLYGAFFHAIQPVFWVRLYRKEQPNKFSGTIRKTNSFMDHGACWNTSRL